MLAFIGYVAIGILTMAGCRRWLIKDDWTGSTDEHSALFAIGILWPLVLGGMCIAGSIILVMWLVKQLAEYGRKSDD